MLWVFLSSFGLSADIDCNLLKRARCLSEEPSLNFFFFLFVVLLSAHTFTTIFPSTVKGFCLFFLLFFFSSQFSIRKQFQFRFASKGSIVKLQSYQRYMNVK